MLPVPSDKFEEKTIADIEKFGLQVMNVLEEDGQPNFTYSVGLWHSYRHPEVIIFGLKKNISHWMLNEIGRRIKQESEEFVVGQYYDGLLEGFECTFLEVPKAHFEEHVGWNIWLNNGIDFSLIQCAWPSTKGMFPWEDDATDCFRNWQPILEFVETT